MLSAEDQTKQVSQRLLKYFKYISIKCKKNDLNLRDLMFGGFPITARIRVLIVEIKTKSVTGIQFSFYRKV